YISDCTDDSRHTEGKHSLYGAHNFVVISGKTELGLFVDTPSRATFDVGYTEHGVMTISVASGAFKLYTITPSDEEKPAESVVKQFRRLIGMSYIAPKWAFGYGQSRWGYRDEKDIREVARRHRENHIPLDAIYLDIDYMDHYKDFTVGGEAFPDLKGLACEMRGLGIHLVPIIDAGIKKEEGYPVYEEGRDKGFFCKDEDGEDYEFGVWPGISCLPDVLDEKAAEWFGDKYRALLDLGIDGFWNDMNEPAMFYSKKNLKRVAGELAEMSTQELGLEGFFKFRELATSLSNNEEDYKSFYHNYRGKRYRHDEVHNLYGFYMTKAAAEGIAGYMLEQPGGAERYRKDPPLLFSRASYIGLHRYAGIWQGDNRSWWSQLKLSVCMTASLNMCGFLYTGADIGGFGDDTTEDLLIRWLSFAVFTPLMRNHSEKWSREQEVYRFGSAEIMRDLIRLRYRLIPWLYETYVKACREGLMMFKPLGFEYPRDEVARRTEDQLLVGDGVMIAPVCEQNATGRVVYLPEPMKMLRIRGAEVVSEEPADAGHRYVEMPLGDVCLFVKEGSDFRLGEVYESVAELERAEGMAAGTKD
ncbi:MAG: alpha-glucosidase, partial [Lachnospiraceae bacterium]|nr:alpha-glucosidase [Lachnospiraceae bacterium]